MQVSFLINGNIQMVVKPESDLHHNILTKMAADSSNGVVFKIETSNGQFIFKESGHAANSI